MILRVWPSDKVIPLNYIWPWAGPGRAWAGPEKAHGRKLRPRPSQALPSGLLFKPKPGPSGKKP